MVTLAWIKATKKEFKVFVRNRVEQIRNNVEPCRWIYCGTKENPADLVTRVNGLRINLHSRRPVSMGGEVK